LSLLQNSNAISTGGGYNLESSLRFRGGQNLTRTPSSAGNRRTYTYSLWLKRGAIGTSPYVFEQYYDANTRSILYFNASSSEALNVFTRIGGTNYQVQTSASYRDSSSWYHIVVAIDTTQATSSNRVKIWVNGEQVTSFSATGYPPQNSDTAINSTGTFYIGSSYASSSYFDGYITEFNLVDGQALTADDFGETDSTTGVWKPKEYAGTYGTNGFYLPMKETQQATGFNTVLWQGNGAQTTSIDNVGFSPDLVWIKLRDTTTQVAQVYDSVRGAGAGKGLSTAETYAEGTMNGGYTDSAYGYISSLDSNGFSLNDGTTATTGGWVNYAGRNYVAWCWDAGSSTVSNTDGSITSSVRANPATGFSVVTYTANGTAGATVGHGLGVAPSMIIIKDRSATFDWSVYHSGIGNTKYIFLNRTDASATSATFWNNTSPTNNVFTLGSTGFVNNSGSNLVAYCFSEVAGFSKFGSYTGNGSTSGPTVTTGFRPAFVLIKNTTTAQDWLIYDDARTPNNTRNKFLKPNSSGAEVTASTSVIDFTDTGFEIKGSSVAINENGSNHIYMAFADTRDAQFNFDASGNKNNWTANNINSNASSETTYDIMNDVATLTDEDTANFATLNPLYAGINGLSASNLTFTPSGWMHIPSTIELPTDSTTGIYWEEDLTVAFAANYHASGVTNGKHTASTAFDTNTAVISMSGGAWRLYKSGDANNNVAITGAGGSASNGDVHMFAYKNGYLYWGINGSWYPTGANPATDTSPLNASQITAQQYALCGGYTGITKSINFGQRPFKYTPPTGYKKLNTYNLPDSTIKDGSQYMNTITYTGDGVDGRVISGYEFAPDLVWSKSRSNSRYHELYDTVRGATNRIISNLTDAESVNANGLKSFTSDGYTFGTHPNVNNSGESYVNWSWRASDSSAVSNTDGTITSTVSANTDSGFSVVSYTGNSTNGATIGHGLGVAPKIVIVKNRDGGWQWIVDISNITGTTYDHLLLNSTASKNSSNTYFSAKPTSTVFSVNGASYSDTGTSPYKYIAYCFADVEGFSKFGSYTGNGSADGPFIYTGFDVKFLLYKNVDAAISWVIYDNVRDPNGNPQSYYLLPNSSGAEGTTPDAVDFLSNGFKIRYPNASINVTGQNHIYMAFAENPFKNSLAR